MRECQPTIHQETQGTHLAKGVQALEGAHESVPAHSVELSAVDEYGGGINDRQRPLTIMISV